MITFAIYLSFVYLFLFHYWVWSILQTVLWICFCLFFFISIVTTLVKFSVIENIDKSLTDFLFTFALLQLIHNITSEFLLKDINLVTLQCYLTDWNISQCSLNKIQILNWIYKAFVSKLPQAHKVQIFRFTNSRALPFLHLFLCMLLPLPGILILIFLIWLIPTYPWSFILNVNGCFFFFFFAPERSFLTPTFKLDPHSFTFLAFTTISDLYFCIIIG